MTVAAARSFLLTVHEPTSAVLEDLSSGRRAHIADLAEVGAQVARWLQADPLDRRPGQDPVLEADGRLGGFDAQLLDEDAATGKELP